MSTCKLSTNIIILLYLHIILISKIYCIEDNVDAVEDANFNYVKLTDEETTLKFNRTAQKFVYKASEGEFPYHVAILRKQDDNVKVYCNGVIVKERSVLAAGSCFIDKDFTEPTDILVLIGTLTLSTGGTVYSVSELVLLDTVDGNNLVIVSTDEEIETSDTIYPIPIEDKNNEMYKRCFVSGWGIHDYSDTQYFDDLMAYSVTIADKEVCDTYDKFDYHDISGTIMCSISENDDKLCNGEFSAPIVCDYKLIALVYFPKQCNEGMVTFSTTLQDYIQDIEKAIVALRRSIGKKFKAKSDNDRPHKGTPVAKSIDEINVTNTCSNLVSNAVLSFIAFSIYFKI